ncbi:unnamed protein product [Ectocarpus sp. 12 AP-2014]
MRILCFRGRDLVALRIDVSPWRRNTREPLYLLWAHPSTCNPPISRIFSCCFIPFSLGMSRLWPSGGGKGFEMGKGKRVIVFQRSENRQMLLVDVAFVRNWRWFVSARRACSVRRGTGLEFPLGT